MKQHVYPWEDAYISPHFSVGLMTSQWSSCKNVKVWKLKRSVVAFKEKFDSIQEQLQLVSCMDDLLSG